jgi:hypothetical protein
MQLQDCSMALLACGSVGGSIAAVHFFVDGLPLRSCMTMLNAHVEWHHVLQCGHSSSRALPAVLSIDLPCSNGGMPAAAL